MKILIIALLLSIVLLSCDCHHKGSGFVYNKETKQPMVNVRIDVYSTKPWKDTIRTPIYTDSNGFFEYEHDFCYNSMHAYTPNYIGHAFNDIIGDTIYLEYKEGN